MIPNFEPDTPEYQAFSLAIEFHVASNFKQAILFYRKIGLDEYAELAESNYNLEILFEKLTPLKSFIEGEEWSISEIKSTYDNIIKNIVNHPKEVRRNPFQELIRSVLACTNAQILPSKLRIEGVNNALSKAVEYDNRLNNLIGAWANYVYAYVSIFTFGEINSYIKMNEFKHYINTNRSGLGAHYVACSHLVSLASVALKNAKTFGGRLNNLLLSSLINQGGFYVDNISGNTISTLVELRSSKIWNLREVHGLCFAALNEESTPYHLLEAIVKGVSLRIQSGNVELLRNVNVNELCDYDIDIINIIDGGFYERICSYTKNGKSCNLDVNFTYPTIYLYKMKDIVILNESGDVELDGHILTDLSPSIFFHDHKEPSQIINYFKGAWIIDDMQTSFVMKSIKYTLAVKPKDDHYFECHDNTLFINDTSCFNHAHWLLDGLPRIMLSLRQMGENATLMFTKSPSLYQLESLMAVGIDVMRVVTLNDCKYPLKLHRAVLSGPNWNSAPALGASYLPLHPEAVLALRGVIFKNYGRAPRRIRTYLSRVHVKTPGRVIKNEHEMIGILEKYGVCNINIPELKFESQRELFYDTDVFVSMPGAGQANMIFMRPGTTVVTFYIDHYSSTMYHALADVLGINYIAIYHEADAFDFSQNLFVNLNDLEEVLKRIIPL